MWAVGRELARNNEVAALTSLIPSAVYPDDEFPLRIYSVHNRKSAAHRPENLRYAIRLSRELRRIGGDFDVIVPQTFIPIFSSCLSHTRTAVVPIVHDVYQPLPLMSGIATWRNLQRGNTIRGIEGCLLERACLRYASTCPTVITVSSSAFETLKQWVPQNKIRITGNGVYLPTFEETSRDVDVICISRFDAPYKNVDILCDAFFDTDVQTVVVGDGRLRSRFERRYASANLKFAGYVTETKKRELLLRSKVLVSASSKEGFGVTLLEGLASGCLVAATDIGPHRYIDQSSNVIKFFSVGDKEALKSAVVELLRLPDDERADIQKQARALITQHWQWPVIARKTELILESVVGV
jgi:glycosyltransferase involved in cell wall biosynthesis